FSVTTEKSSLGPAFAASGGRFCVCAFHGYSHSYTCQLEYHPNVIAGAGLEDLETWRESSALPTCLPRLSHVHNDATALAEAMRSLSITDDDLDTWEREEVEFFSQIGDEDPHDVHAVAYVECLQELRDLDSHRHRANSQFLTFATTGRGSHYAHDLSATRRMETEHRHANEHYTRVHDDMGIGIRWTPTTPEYITALKYIKERKYHHALNKLQKLVTQRLFELQRLNVAQTVSSNACKAIQLAIAAYNAAAAALDPPRPPLNWTEIGNYHFLEQFALLQDTRQDVRDAPPYTPCNREIERLNIEVRLFTLQFATAILFRQVRDHLVAAGDPMLDVVMEFTERRQRINSELLSRIHQVYNLAGYTGVKGAGTRVGSLPLDNNSDVAALDGRAADDDQAADEEVDILEGDEEQDALGHLVEFISALSIQ
ncbi:hypothetical protein BC835DRAFT_1311796, partial [Cytidiella melzeri]